MNPWGDDALDKDKEYFNVSETVNNLKTQCSEIERELKSSSATMEKILYDSVINYKKQIQDLKIEIINNFESKYFKDKIKEIEIIEKFYDNLNNLYKELKNVK